VNAERLLALFDRVVDAPDAIPRLRRFVLDLAVRGKLVEQDPGDEQAIELVERSPGEASSDKVDLPVSWRRAALGNLIEFKYGKGLKASQRGSIGPVPVFGSRGIVAYTAEALCPRPAIIVGRKGSAGALTRCDGPSWTTDVAYYVEPPGYFDLPYLLVALMTLDLPALAKGVKPGLSRADAYSLPLAVPPLHEQQRIVQRVEELMGLIDRLEAARAERDATRVQLTTNSLVRLTAPRTDPVRSPAHARFAVDVLPDLTMRAEQIRLLRQTILDLGVRGRLVEQRSTDTPATRMLTDTSAPSARSPKSGMKLYRTPRARETEASQSLPLPHGWEQATLGKVALKITDGAHKTPTYVAEGVPFVSVKDFSAGKLDLSDTRYIPPDEHRVLYQRCDPRRGDILIGRIGTLGKAVVVDTDVEFSLFVSVGLIRCDRARVVPEYLRLLLNSPLAANEFNRIKVGGGTHTNKLNLGDLRNVTFPIPPVAEQHRIVAKVDALMVLAGRLGATLSSSGTTRQRLLEALIKEALSESAPIGKAA
jgi:type I restriction enzyme, S subunit